MEDDLNVAQGLTCPKCGGSALGASRTDIPTSLLSKVFVRVKCLNCGGTFDLTEPLKE